MLRQEAEDMGNQGIQRRGEASNHQGAVKGNFRMTAPAATEGTKSRLDKTHWRRNDFFENMEETDSTHTSEHLGKILIRVAELGVT